jgi:uncharacterized protein
VQAVTDEALTRPLGFGPAKPGRFDRVLAPLRVIKPVPVAAAALAAGGLALGAYLSFASNPLGGEPHVVVPIEIRAAPAPAPAAPAAQPLGPAAEAPAMAGIGVVRPAGNAAPGAIVITIPDAKGPEGKSADAKPGALASAPDRRLIERGRYGALPRIGEDGARPLDVYARPSTDALPGGAAPAGRIALLVTGLGVGQAVTADAVARLPPAVTLALTPYGSDLERTAARAREAGHEIMLQAPMEPFDYPDDDPGPQTLLTGRGAAENGDRLAWLLGRFPGFIGLVNQMGGRLTADEAALSPILREVAARGLGFVDDGSSARSQVQAVAGRVKLPAARAEVVVDAVPRADAIDRELARLEEAARRKGTVLAVAGAQPLTVERLARWSRDLEARGILLVPVSRTLRGTR